MVRQNYLLHVTTAIFVINGSNCDKQFDTKVEGEDGYDGSIREWSMKAKTEDGTYVFHLVDSGGRGHCYFLHEKTRKEEAEQWINKCFNGILHQYGVDECRRILGGETHI